MNLQTLANIFGSTSLFVGVLTYCSALDEAKKERSMQFAATFSGDALTGARGAILDGQLEAPETMGRVNAIYDGLTDAGKRQAFYGGPARTFLLDFAQASRDGKGVAREIHVVVDFFDQVDLCVKSGACDKDLAVSLLRPQACDLWTWFYPFVEKTRGERGARARVFASGMEDFTGDCFGDGRKPAEADAPWYEDALKTIKGAL